jgi:hypothetical protein
MSMSSAQRHNGKPRSSSETTRLIRFPRPEALFLTIVPA